MGEGLIAIGALVVTASIISMLLTGTLAFRIWLPPAALFVAVLMVGASVLTEFDALGDVGALVVFAMGIVAAFWWDWRRRRRVERAKSDEVRALARLRGSGTISAEEYHRRAAQVRRSRERWTWRGHGRWYWTGAAVLLIWLGFGLTMCIAAIVTYG